MSVNWTSGDGESGMHDFEFGLMSNPSNIESPDIQAFTTTHQHPLYLDYHSAISEGQQFYIAIKAINKAGLSHMEVSIQ